MDCNYPLGHLINPPEAWKFTHNTLITLTEGW